MDGKKVELLNGIMSYIPLIIMIIGTLGSICNIIIFRSLKFRLNSCVFYLLLSTIFDLIYLLSSVLTRFIKNDFRNVFIDQSILFCKFRTYIVVLTPTLSTYYLMFASIDRCLSTSSLKKWRNLSNINLAWKISLCSFIFFLIYSSHIIFFYELEKKDLNNSISICIPSNEIYRIYFSLSLLLSSPLITYMIMFICTIITLLRIRKSKYRMKSLFNRRRHQNLNRHLIIMIFVQIGLGMLLTFFRCGFLIWNFLRKNNSSQIEIYLFLDQFSLLIYYLNFAKSFPVYMITSQLFRHVFYQQITFFIQAIFHSNRKPVIRLNNKHQSQLGSEDGQMS
jgi:hypothetical protein